MPEGDRARRQSPLGENKALQCGNQEPNSQHSSPYFQALGTVQPGQSSIQMEGGAQLLYWLLLFSCVCLTVYVMICAINLCQSYSISIMLAWQALFDFLILLFCPFLEQCCHRERDCKDTQRSKTIALETISKDVTIALTRLQADMQDVLRRLNTLEAQKATQVRNFQRAPSVGKLLCETKAPIISNPSPR